MRILIWKYGGGYVSFSYIGSYISKNTRGPEIDLTYVKSIFLYNRQYILQRLANEDYTRLLAGDDIRYFIEVIGYNASERRHQEKGIRNLWLQGYSETVDFYSPDYSQGYIVGDKDYRRTLYWNPAVETDENGEAIVEFYNNSECRKLVIDVEMLLE